MKELSPLTSASLAREIYAVRTESAFSIFLQRKEFSNKKFSNQKLHADTGGYLIKKQSAFGVCAMGGAGYENELFIIFRGTDTAHDVISDLWIGISRSKTGLPVYHIHLFSARSV